MNFADDTPSLFRHVNEQIRRLSTTFGVRADEEVRIVCECERPECAEQIPMTLDEYDRLRSDPARFAIMPGHPFPAGGEPEAENEHYWTVARDESAEPESGRSGSA